MASAAEQLASNLNFSTFAKAEDLKKRLWFTLAALLVYRLGTHIPLPGLNPEAYAAAFQGQSGGILGLFNMFAGGAVERMAIFALGIMPYISASIIVQLMTSVVPALEQLKKEGEQGRKIINQYTRYLAVVFCAVQAYGIAVSVFLPGSVHTSIAINALSSDGSARGLVELGSASHAGERGSWRRTIRTPTPFRTSSSTS